MSIQGLKLQMASDELVTTLNSRIEYHGKFSNSRVGSAVDNLAQQRDHHQDRVTLFKFMVAHVIPNETFVLDENDLRKLEVIGQHGY
jgi:hypothetical protein